MMPAILLGPIFDMYGRELTKQVIPMLRELKHELKAAVL